jgi:two-component system nitrogen regulation sensor histidine kinase NtrY
VVRSTVAWRSTALTRPERSRVPLARRGRLAYERRLHIGLLSFAAVALCSTGLYLSQLHISVPLRLSFLIVLASALWLVEKTVAANLLRPLQTIANILVAIRLGDYSLRVRGGRRGDSLGDLALEVNALANDLQSERLSSLESSTLLQRVLASINTPVLAFDPANRLAMFNPAAARMLPQRPRGQSAQALGLEAALTATDGAVLSLRAGVAAQWVVHRNLVRLRGVPHSLLLLADISQALRQEERLAWQRLIRVLGHEINNSLTPIKSLAGSLLTMVEREQLHSADFARGLAVIQSRADSLNRFLSAYQQVAQLPPPILHPVDVRSLLGRVALLETRVPVELADGPPLLISADRDQLEQALINLVRNAAEATLEAPSSPVQAVELSSFKTGNLVTIRVMDRGPGIGNTTNLFVPFYTTKRTGSGLGLLLVKQIAEAHGGLVTLSARPDQQSGACADLLLPNARS